MGVFRQFPYSNFHEMNMDEIIKIIKNMLEEWATYHAQWDTWKHQIENDWSSYQTVMNEAWQNMQNFINNYFDNLDVQEEINNKIVSMIQTGEFGLLVNEYIPPAVSAWLALHITQPTGVVIDTSLTVAGACADAKATGDAINDVKSDFNKIVSPIYNKSLFELGGVASSDGTLFEATNRIRSINTFTKDEIIGVVTENGYLVMPYAWSNGSFIGVLQNDGTFAIGGTPTYVNAYTFVDDYDYKVTIKKTDDTDMVIDDAEKLLLKTLTDSTLSFPLKAADAKATGDAINEVKSDFNKIISPIYNKSLFELGGVSSSDGTLFEATNRIRSINTFTKDEIMKVTAENGYLFMPYAWSSGSFIGVLQNDGTFAIGGIPTYVNAYTFVDDYDYKVVIKKTDDSNLIINDAEKLWLTTLTDTSLSFPLKAADAKATGDRLKEVENIITNTLEGVTVGELIQYKITDLSLFTYGFAINSSGVLGEYSDCYATKDYIPVVNGARVRALLELINTTDYFQWIACYNSSKTFIGRIGGEYVGEIDEALLEGTKYIRISLSYVGENNVSSYDAYIYYPIKSNIGSPKNKWYILGDSISAGYYSMMISDVPAGMTPSISYEDGTCSLWDATLNHNYWGYINKWFFHRDLIGKAYPAQGYLHTAANSQNGIYVVKNTDFSDAGLITVAWGLNDWHYSMTRGDHTLIDASEPIATVETDASTITTINQAIWYCLGVLIDKAPQAKILVQTPINAWRYGGDFDSKWAINTSLSQSGTLKDIHDDIIYWCDYYGLEYIDMTFNNSVVNLVNIKDAIIDGSHPSDETHKQLARSIWTKVGY